MTGELGDGLLGGTVEGRICPEFVLARELVFAPVGAFGPEPELPPPASPPPLVPKPVPPAAWAVPIASAITRMRVNVAEVTAPAVIAGHDAPDVWASATGEVLGQLSPS